jgi:hypothetical protein
METGLLAGPKLAMDAELPPPHTVRWTARRKAAVVAAVRAGKITLEEACRYYQLSEEEFLGWRHVFEAHGLRGLKVTRGYRRNAKPRS